MDESKHESYALWKGVTKDWNTAIKDSKKSFHIDVWPSSKQSLPLIFFSDPLKKGEVQYVAVETSASRFYSYTKTFRNLSRTKWVKVLISNINVYHNITGQSFFFFGACVLEKQADNQIRLYKIRFRKKKQTRFVILPTFLTMMLCNPRNITKKMTDWRRWLHQTKQLWAKQCELMKEVFSWIKSLRVLIASKNSEFDQCVKKQLTDLLHC